MVIHNLIQFLHLFAYLMVTAQLLFYLIILGDALRTISIHSFLEQRQAVDALMVKRFKFIYYACEHLRTGQKRKYRLGSSPDAMAEPRAHQGHLQPDWNGEPAGGTGVNKSPYWNLEFGT